MVVSSFAGSSKCPLLMLHSWTPRIELDSSRLVPHHVSSNSLRYRASFDMYAPPDSVTRDRYRAWLQLLIDGNQNMIRVWGGGIYEADDFYEICDGACGQMSVTCASGP